MNHIALYLLLRVILGILFFFQGYDKVCRIGVIAVAQAATYELGQLKIPRWLLLLLAGVTSYIELIAGALLILGLFKVYALYALVADLILVTIAFSLIKSMWNWEVFIPRLLLLSLLLYIPGHWDEISLDMLLYNIKTNK